MKHLDTEQAAHFAFSIFTLSVITLSMLFRTPPGRRASSAAVVVSVYLNGPQANPFILAPRVQQTSFGLVEVEELIFDLRAFALATPNILCFPLEVYYSEGPQSQTNQLKIEFALGFQGEWTWHILMLLLQVPS